MKKLGELNLNDVGGEVELGTGASRKVVMGIKAPKGKCFIFGSHPVYDNTKAEAVKAFMEQHSN